MGIASIFQAGFVGLALGLAASPAPGQAAEVTVTANLESGVVKLGERTALLVSVEGGARWSIDRNDGIADLPEVEGLRLGPVSGPSTREFQSFVNGRVSVTRSVTWTVLLNPLRAGEYEIPPLDVIISGRAKRTTPLRLKVVEDMRGADLGFLTVEPSSVRVVEGQPFTVEVRLGWDEALSDVNFADLSLGFWDGIPGVVELQREFPRAGARRIDRGVTVNGGADVSVEEHGSIEVRGRGFRQLHLLRSFIPTRSGRLEYPDSFLNFGRVEERGSFFQRRAEKVKDYFVKAPGFYVDVIPLPEQGQPFDYTGAVGNLSASAVLDARDLQVGDSAKLTVEWTGEGNLEFFGAPDLGRIEAFDGFRIYGRAESKAFGSREVTYDIAPKSAELTVMPAVPLRVFDPVAGAYTTVETEPIPIRVRALAGAVELDDPDAGGSEFKRDLRDIETRPVSPDRVELSVPPRWLVLVALFGAPMLGLCLRLLVRRGGDPATPLARRRRRARRRLARALARADGPEDELRALHAFLADRSGETGEVWVGRDVSQGLSSMQEGAGLDPAELEGLIARLERAVWAGSGEGVGRGEVLAVADRLLGGGL